MTLSPPDASVFNPTLRASVRRPGPPSLSLCLFMEIKHSSLIPPPPAVSSRPSPISHRVRPFIAPCVRERCWDQRAERNLNPGGENPRIGRGSGIKSRIKENRKCECEGKRKRLKPRRVELSEGAHLTSLPSCVRFETFHSLSRPRRIGLTGARWARSKAKENGRRRCRSDADLWAPSNHRRIL